MQVTAKPLDRNHLSLLVAIVLLGNVLFRFIELPAHTWRLDPFGSPLEVRVTGTWLLVALMVGLVCTGTNFVLHDHLALGAHPDRPIYVAWILPGAVAGLSALVLSFASAWQLWLAGLGLAAALIALAIAGEYTALSPEGSGYGAARLGLNVLAYVLAFAFFALIYQSRMRSLVTSSIISAISAVIALDLLAGAEVPFRRVVVLAGVLGLILGESTWALNYWQISAWVGGLLLLLVFYAVTNLAHQHLLGRLTVATVVEFAAVVVAVLIIIAIRIL